MWYGVLGTRELLQRSYKNLEQRVQLECDGQYIPLPSLQGIAVLNIPSYAGGTNFWGGTKEDDVSISLLFDDSSGRPRSLACGPLLHRQSPQRRLESSSCGILLLFCPLFYF
ncbi:diacylglycerol kinase eta-like [Pteropus vampyrus]|uniref:Diacylglycerol kinase eta-like n=1 Tax=Pteropus vampyrus TaxID=132908 RepID=A0A6P6C653_PTEVA|nr:diacylglycerol kinase eta-like [Pteropus vampyrus]